MDFKTMADKDNAVPGRVATVPLDLAIGHYKTPSVFDVRRPSGLSSRSSVMMAMY